MRSLLLAALLCAGCADPSLALGDCEARVAALKKRDAGPPTDTAETCDPAAHAFAAQFGDGGIPAEHSVALRRDRYDFAALLAQRCAGSGYGDGRESPSACIIRVSATLQLCAGAVRGCAGKEADR